MHTIWVMRLTFVHLKGFTREWKHFRLSDEDLQALENQLMENPESRRGDGGYRRTSQAAIFATVAT